MKRTSKTRKISREQYESTHEYNNYQNDNDRNYERNNF
jgi:hypothetical protein